MSPLPLTQRSEQTGFALVMTLIMVALTAIIVIGFLGNAASDRVAADTSGGRYRAELAAASGLEGAKKVLTAISSGTSKSANDYFIVTTSSDSNNVPYYFIGTADGGSVGSPTAQDHPLYSGGATPTPVPASSPVPSPAFTGTRAQQTINGTPVNYPRLYSSPAPHSPNPASSPAWQKSINTSWQIVDNTIPATAEHARFTYWIEDLAGYVDANVAGNTDGTSSTHIRSLGYDPKEVALFTLFANTSQTDPGNTWATTLVGDHPILFTPWTTRVGGTANSANDQVSLASLVANLSTDLEQNVIPFGLGYQNQGQLKTNINTIIKNLPNDTGVTQIATAISTNLPNFKSARQGGLLSTQDYNKTIAANIIGYAQPVTNPPLVSATYRGIGLYPFVVEYCDKFEWTMPPQFGNAPAAYYQTSPTSDYFADVTVTTYIQVWNMFGTDITSGQLRFVDLNKTGIGVFHNGNGNQSGTPTSFDVYDTVGGQWRPWQAILDFSNPTPTPTPSPAPTPPKPPAPSPTPVIGAGTLHANEYRVFQIAQRTYTYDTGTTTDPSRGASSKFSFGLQGSSKLSSNDTGSSYQVYWNGVLVDQPPPAPNGGITRNSWVWDPIHNPVTAEFHTSMPALRYSSANSAPFLLGDPRGNYYIQASQSDIPYANTSWWGRILMTGSPGSTYYANEARIASWPDGGHNTTTPGPSPSGTQPPASPTPAPFPALETTKAPARISSAGQLSSITELSYIYDPFQQDPFTSTPGTATAVNNGWANAWTNGFSSGSANKAKYASHSTLRIGRPEFKTFDTNGTRAWQFLDIFSAGDPSTSPTPSPLSNQISTRGKININTASKDVLRTLGAGIKIGNLNTNDVDQAILPSTVYGPKTTTEADIFANAVIAARTTSPFLSTPGLATLKSGTNAFFGNPAVWPSGAPTAPTEWNDAAAEEYFAKIFNLTTVRSRNFRVFVTGQVYIPANGSQPERVIATANKVYHVFLKPTRDPTTGAITAQTTQVTYSADVF